MRAKIDLRRFIVKLEALMFKVRSIHDTGRLSFIGIPPTSLIYL
jgi:hypothetical protein